MFKSISKVADLEIVASEMTYIIYCKIVYILSSSQL